MDKKNMVKLFFYCMVIGIKFVINKMYLLIDIFGNDICE